MAFYGGVSRHRRALPRGCVRAPALHVRVPAGPGPPRGPPELRQPPGCSIGTTAAPTPRPASRACSTRWACATRPTRQTKPVGQGRCGERQQSGRDAVREVRKNQITGVGPRRQDGRRATRRAPGGDSLRRAERHHAAAMSTQHRGNRRRDQPRHRVGNGSLVADAQVVE